MRVFRNSQLNLAQLSSKKRSGKTNEQKAQPESPKKRLSASEVRNKLEKLKANKFSDPVVKKTKPKSNQVKLSQYMGGGILPTKESKNPTPTNVKPMEKDLEDKVVPSEVAVEIDSEEIESNDSPNTDNYVLGTDIANNDPNSDETKQKLKSVLSLGAFAFSDKERSVLSKILGE